MAAWAAGVPDCRQIRDLVVVAHMDDDLLFMNPDIQETIAAGGCVQAVYLTASDRGEGAPYMLGRERGIRAAYARMAGVADDWDAGELILRGHHLARFTLRQAPRVRIVALRIADPWLGKGWGSLTPLSQMESDPSAAVDAVGPPAGHYDRHAFVALLAALIRDYAPTTVRTLDAGVAVPYAYLCWRCLGDDHPDHIAGARLLREAMALAPGPYATVAYLGYPSQERPVNLAASQIQAKTEAFLAYMRHDYRYCPAGEACVAPAGPEAAWVSRIYHASDHGTPADVLDTGGTPTLLTVDEGVNRPQWVGGQTGTLPHEAPRTADLLRVFRPAAGPAGALLRRPDGEVLSALIGDPSAQAEPGLVWSAIRGARLTRVPVVSEGMAPWAVGMGFDGRLRVSRWQPAVGHWSAWLALKALPGANGTVAVAADTTGDGALVLALDHRQRLWCARLRADAPARAAPWRRVGGVRARGGLALLRSGQGQAEAYVADGPSGRLQRLVQRAGAPSCAGWSAPRDLGMAVQGTPAAIPDADGHAIVAAREPDGGPLWLIERGRTRRLAIATASDARLAMVGGALMLSVRLIGPRQDYLLRVRRQGAWRSEIVPAAAAPLASTPPDSGTIGRFTY